MKSNRVLFNIFIAILALFIGLFIGASVSQTRQSDKKCNNGISYQHENGVVYETYLPELDECR